MRSSSVLLGSLVVGLGALLGAPREAQAIERQHHIGLDPSLSILKVDDKSTFSVGAGIGAHYTYGINDQFNLMVALNASRVAQNQEQDHPDSPHTRPANVAYGLAGIGYVIDVLRWVPYFGLLAGGYHLSGGTLDSSVLAFGGAVQVGLDYQLSRHWALGVAGQQHFILTKLGDYPSYTTAALRLEYMWGF